MIMAGFAEVDITPEPGSLMACFPTGPGRTPRRAEKAHDPLKAKALAVSSGDSHVCICSLDLCAIRSFDVAEIRREVEMCVPGLAGHRTALAATHTHSSPETTYLFGNTPADPYVESIRKKIASAVVSAYQNRIPVRVSVGSADAHLAFNRRVLNASGKSVMVLEYEEGRTDGVYDPELNVLRLDDMNGAPKYVLVNYTAHALTVGPSTFVYTADYPGVVCERIERESTGVKALFINGAAGNIHPRQCMRQDFEATEKIGAGLAESALSAMDSAKALKDDVVLSQSRVLAFDNRVDPSIRENVEVSCFRIGDTLTGFVPGELYVEYQLAFKKSMLPWKGMIAGYANGFHGYIPTRDSYPQGGYGVNAYGSDTATLTRTALPECAGDCILESLVNMARQLAGE